MRAQGVGIDTTTPINPTRPHVHHQGHAAAPHDQRSARRHRHPDLVVFQTNLTAQGFYYNVGTPGVPNWVALGAGDNLGNHTATQTLNLMGNALVGTGATLGTAVGLGVRADGGLNIGQNTNGNLFLGYQSGNATLTGKGGDEVVGVGHVLPPAAVADEFLKAVVGVEAVGKRPWARGACSGP